jgi:hypothetical protein
MTDPGRSRRVAWTRSCAVTPWERALRAVLAVFVAAFAVSVLPNLWYAIPAAAVTILLTVAAITGWCPGMPRAVAEPAENELGFPEARRRLDV